MGSFNEDLFEKKLLTLKDSQDSISGLSHWCLERPQHHKKIVSLWLQMLKKVKIEQRLTLFYLANDVIQYSKRKGYEFVESWGPALQKATTMVRDDKVESKILRLFKIWKERSIYDEAFLADLAGLLSSRKQSQGKDDAPDFQPSVLISKIKTCKTLEDDTDSKRKIVNDSHLPLNDADSLLQSLKDRRHGSDAEQELEEGVDTMVAFISALKSEIEERKALIETLEQSETFYENQRGEVKIVCNAYKNFSNRVKILKKKLDELTQTLPSPIPSPDINAPSPSPESDIELPDDNVPTGKYSAASSFMGKTEEIYSLIDSPKGDSPPRKTYKPPTPPRSFKRKSSPKSYSPPPPVYISNTPTLSSSSASNYSSNSPYQPVTKPTYTPNTTSYSAYSTASSYSNSNYYNPEENDQMNSYDSNTASQDSYHLPGTNPPPPSVYTPPPRTDLASGRNPSPTYSDKGRYEAKFTGRYDEPAVPPPSNFIPPPAGDYRPFYTSNNLTTLPLLGEDCPPTNVNGLDSFLKENSLHEDPAPAPISTGGGFSSFMGNLNLPFDFQKGLFSESCDDTPSSPPMETLDDNTSHYFSDSNQEGGKPIEVINRTKQPDLSEILKVISMQPPPAPRGDLELAAPAPTLPPPPLPPALDEAPIDKPWSQPPLLPPKFPTWSQGNDWPDTPASPPSYEKSGGHQNVNMLPSFTEPAEFDESNSLPLGDTDTDLRSLGVQQQGDIDHRNLISLTSSPRDENPWSNSQDTDYRKMALAPKRAQDVNVESVDMEMSSDEEMESEAAKTSVSFSLAPVVKPLVDSPLKEAEEPKKKLISLTLTPPPKLLEPPPLPDVDEIFDTEVKQTPPLLPPPVPPSFVQPIPTLQEPGFSPRGRGTFGPRFNNQRPNFPQWQNNNIQVGPRPRPTAHVAPMFGPRFRPDANFRGRPPWFRGQRPPRFGGW